MSNEIEELEKQAFEEDDFSELPPSDIIAYNELRSCSDLFRMYANDDLIIQPEFQREIVWKSPAQTRFIDSLIKGLPIPSMCFSLDYNTQKWQVIDGLQRMSSIIRFFEGDWKLSKLDDIEPKISGVNVSTLANPKSNLNIYYKRIENNSIPITVLRCDYSKTSHTNYLFTIFHRLNTGGMKLNNQEIRNCIFSGPFNDLLNDLNENKTWMKLNRMKSTEGYRFTKQEIILRFFAFYDQYKKYNGHLAKFLNNYMHDNVEPDDEFLVGKRNLFEETINLIYKKLFDGKAPSKLSVTYLEALLVGVASNLNSVSNKPKNALTSRYNKLISHEEFTEQKLREGLSKRQRVIARMNAAIESFT
ncbi:MAG: DUF262 domain-containing protein [Nitrospirales bacterium]